MDERVEEIKRVIGYGPAGMDKALDDVKHLLEVLVSCEKEIDKLKNIISNEIYARTVANNARVITEAKLQDRDKVIEGYEALLKFVRARIIGHLVNVEVEPGKLNLIEAQRALDAALNQNEEGKQL